MSQAVDSYIDDVIRRGDEGSKLLAAECAKTLRNSDAIDVVKPGMNNIAVIRVPKNCVIVAHSSAGDYKIRDPEDHAASLVDRLYLDATRVRDTTPVAMTDVIDARTSDRKLMRRIGKALTEEANKRHIGIVNGELAILGERVNTDANISGTMISIAPSDIMHSNLHRHEFKIGDVKYVAINPRGKAVYLNSDGVGTKMEFYERGLTKMFHAALNPALRDQAAMLLDDTAKIFAKAVAIFSVVEANDYNSDVMATLDLAADRISAELGINYTLVHAFCDDRLRGWDTYARAYNMSGSAISLIDDATLENLPHPEAGDYLIALRGDPNPRSNGITDKRKQMVKRFGKEWHKVEDAKPFLDFLTSPSTVFYPLFYALLKRGLASSVYHMSGSAYEGKLAKPLASKGLYVKAEGLYEPDWRELALAGFDLTPAETAYAKWPMGNEGFVTTKYPDKALRSIKKYGLDGKVVGQVERAKKGKTGVELVGVASGSQNVYFSGIV